MFERFTDRARRVVVLAQEEARLLNHNYIGTEHVLLGLIHEGEGIAARALVSLGIPLEKARQQIEEIIGSGQAPPRGHIPFTQRAKKVLELSLREALQLGHNYIGTEHVLLGLVREGEGVAAQVLVKSGATLDAVRSEVIRLLESGAGVEVVADAAEWKVVSEEEASMSGTTYGHANRATGAYRGPVCPTCKAPLERTARTVTLDVAEAGADGSHPVRFVFCSACGESLLASDA